MKIRHKVSGKVLEVMEGTKFAQSAYEVVSKGDAGKKATDTDKKVKAGDAGKKATDTDDQTSSDK